MNTIRIICSTCDGHGLVAKPCEAGDMRTEVRCEDCVDGYRTVDNEPGDYDLASIHGDDVVSHIEMSQARDGDAIEFVEWHVRGFRARTSSLTKREKEAQIEFWREAARTAAAYPVAYPVAEE